MSFGWPQIIVLLVAVQRLAELLIARRNTTRLLARGGHEVGARHYPLFILLHGSWLLAVFIAAPADAPISWPFLWIFVALQLCRVWVVQSLGPYWTTRIITMPGAPLVQRGPFRFIRHPNYTVVCGEIAVLPLCFGLWQIAVIWSALNAALLIWRIRVEDWVLVARRL